MTAPAVFYFPRLHLEFAPAWARGRVIAMPCGLPERSGTSAPKTSAPGTPDSGPAAREAQEAARRALPLSPARSRAVLEELLRLGEDHALTGILRQVAALRLADDARRGEKAGENAALDAFAASGRADLAAGVKSPECSPEQHVLDCQKLLLLAYSLEERVLELERLESRVSLAEESLYAALGEADAEDLRELAGADPDDDAHPGDDADSPEVPVSWRLATEAMLPFLPAGAALFTADAAVVRDLREENLLRPLAGELAGGLSGSLPGCLAGCLADWPEERLAGLLHARLPGWRLAGRRSRPADRPWLDREYDIVAANPEA